MLICLATFKATAQEEAEAWLLKKYSDNGYALRKVIPIGDLPQRIRFKQNDVSLVPDPMDRTGAPRYGKAKPYIVVYLVNDTDEVIPRVIGELRKVGSQVRIGGYWFPREPLVVGCGTVPEPTDLPPRSALALGGLSDQRGDVEGEIRYSFAIPNGRVESNPLRGRYMRREVEKRLFQTLPETDLQVSLNTGLMERDWKESLTASNPEEFCALLEIYRHYRLSLRERSLIMNWLFERVAKGDATPDERRAIARIKSILALPWLIENDGQAVANRCISALQGKPSRSYGTPEKCRAVVWRFLAEQRGLPGALTLPGTDPIPVRNSSLFTLVKLAKESLDSEDKEIADSAADFLGTRMVTEEMFSTEELLGFLQSDRKRRVYAGLSGLSARNRILDAVPWLIDLSEEHDPNLLHYYRRFLFGIDSRYRAERGVEDWEKKILLHLLEKDPLEALKTVSGHGVIRHLGNLSEEFAGILRDFLKEELSEERKQWWIARTEQDLRGESDRRYDVSCQALRDGIRLLDSLDEPRDVPLLQAMLEHPAANVSTYSDGSTTLFFSVRNEARESLQRRKIAVPDSVVTKIEMEPPPKPRDRTEDFMRYVLTHETAILGLSLLVLTSACFVFWRSAMRRKFSVTTS